MTTDQAIQIIDQLLSMAPVTRAAHAQGIEALKLLASELKKKEAKDAIPVA